MKKKFILAAVAVGAVALSGAGIANAANSEFLNRPHPQFGMRGAENISFRQHILDNLKQKLSEEVKSGKITQQQMDEKLQKVSEHKNNPQFFQHQKMGKGPGFASEKLASFLGLSQTDLQAAIKSGKKIEDIATTQGKTAEDLKTFFEAQHQDMKQQMTERLAEEVKSGKITQEQMDKRLAQMENHMGKQGKHGSRGFFHKKVAPGVPN